MQNLTRYLLAADIFLFNIFKFTAIQYKNTHGEDGDHNI